jgi:hypothetical protein
VHAARAPENEFAYEGEWQFGLWSEIKGVSRPLYIPCSSYLGKNVCGLETAKPVVKQGRKAMDLVMRLPGCTMLRCSFFESGCKILLMCKEEGVMSRKMGMFWMIGVLLLGMVNAVWADVSYTDLGTKAWIWEGTGTGLAFEKTTFAANDSFWITSTENSNTLKILDNVTDMNSIDIYKDGNKYYAAITDDHTATQIELGTAAKFYFTFKQGSNSSNMYDLVAASNGKQWKLIQGDYTLTTQLGSCCGIHPTPVPGSALLLGSSLIGLVGIGSRRKKA